MRPTQTPYPWPQGQTGAREEELTAEPPSAIKLRTVSCTEGTDSPKMLVKNVDFWVAL